MLHGCCASLPLTSDDSDAGSSGEGSPLPLAPNLVQRVLGVLLGAVSLKPVAIGAMEKNLHGYRAIAQPGEPAPEPEPEPEAGPSGMLAGSIASRARWSRRYLHFDDDETEAALRQVMQLLHRAAPAGMLMDLIMAESRGEDVSGDGGGSGSSGGGADAQALHLGRQARAFVLLDYLLTPLAEAAVADSAFVGELAATCSWVLEDTIAAADCGSAAARQREWVALAPLGVAVSTLATECVGKLASLVGSESFAPLLIHALYPLLERVSDESAEVSDAALRALVSLARTMGAPGSAGGPSPLPQSPDEQVRWLLMENIDYVVDVICARLRYLHEHPTTPMVLQAVLAYTGTAVLPYIHDTLEALFECVEVSEESFLLNFFLILRTVVESLLLEQQQQRRQAGMAADHETVDSEAGRSEIASDAAQLQGYLDRYLAFLSGGDEEQEEEQEAQRGPDPAEDQAEPSPESSPMLSVVMATRVLETCQHFVAGRQLRLKLIVLQVMGSALRFIGRQLQLQEVHAGPAPPEAAPGARPLQLSDFLPVVAASWAPFCRRLSEQTDSDAPALVAATGVIKELAQCCPDFISRRFHDEAWPPLARYLTRYLAARRAATASSASLVARQGFTRQHKAIAAILECMAALTAEVRIFRAQTTQRVSSVASSCLGFLSAEEPAGYQDASRRIFRNLIAIEADAVWLLLAGLASPDPEPGTPRREREATEPEPADGADQDAMPWAVSLSPELRAAGFRSFADDPALSRVRKGAPAGLPRAAFQRNCAELLREMPQ